MSEQVTDLQHWECLMKRIVWKHKDTDWQEKMVEIEMRVSDMDGYKDIAFFHHLMLEKR